MEQNKLGIPATDTNLIAEEIAATLRALVKVPPLSPDDLLARHGFWERCQPIVPVLEYGDPSKRRIFVDGFRGACQYNSLKVYRAALEPGLSLWWGYALYGGEWHHHAWCMLGEHIVETTVPFRLYYGAALLPDELQYFAAHFEELPANSRKREAAATCKDGARVDVWGDDVKAFAETIGRERDWKTGQLKDGLGR